MARFLRSTVALLATAAILLAGPIGSAGVALAAAPAGQESQLERSVDGLTAAQRAELELRLSEGLAVAGVDLRDPSVQARLAGVLGVSQAEIRRAVGAVNASAEGISQPILFLFVAAALIFAPSAFRSVGGTLYEWLAETGAVEGLPSL
ncbi:MAG: hypothetical protein JSS97_10245 [Actinobacteria bacterium]|nr:hypothetical protein [Actinomycetota bacterium]